MKFHLPTKLQSSPRWHKSHLQDLLTMEAKFAMFHFLTFRSKEMLSLKWTKIDQLKELIKNIQMNMTWKDCLVECAVLFHS
jgi:hypothetical protein